MQIHLEVIAEKLQIKPSVIAKLKFKNTSLEPIKIAKFVIGDGKKPTNAFFSVECNKSRLPYKGLLDKHIIANKDVFVILEPDQQIEGVFDISNSYSWSSDISEYVIQYEIFKHFSNMDLDLQSDIIKFEF